MLNTFVHKAEW